MPERDCKTCTAKNKRYWGCYARQHGKLDEHGEQVIGKDGQPVYFWTEKAFMPIQIDGVEDYACPRQHIHENPDTWHMLLLYYGLYQKGHLPDDGCASRQSHFTLSLFALLDQYNRECDDELDERRRRNAAAPETVRG